MCIAIDGSLDQFDYWLFNIYDFIFSDALLADLQSTTSHISSYQSGSGVPPPRTPSPVDNDVALGGLGHPPAASSTPIHGAVYAQVIADQCKIYVIANVLILYRNI